MRTKAILCVSLIILTTTLNVVEAQDLTASVIEHSMLKEGKSWIYEYHHFEENENEPPTEKIYPVRYTIIGDTVIDNKDYYKMFQEIDNKKTYYAAYREEGLKVFVRHPLIDMDIIVVDFEYEGLYDPNGYEENDPYSAIKEYIDYIEVDGIQYKRHTYYEKNKEEKLVIGVEGIGYTKYGLMYPSIYGAQPDCVCDFKIFSSCEMNGKCIFTRDDFYKAGSTHPDEYTDPQTNVVYTYDPNGTTAEVKRGVGHDFDGSNTVYKAGSPNASGNVDILEKVIVNGKEFSVTRIGDYAFCKLNDLIHVSIPSSVRTIGREAFVGCSNLESVDMKEGLQQIGQESFRDCGLTTVILPASVREIEPGALWMSDLAALTSLIEEPFEVNKICNLDAYQTILYVPVGTIEKYRATPDWNLFAEIHEVTTNNIGMLTYVSEQYSNTLYDLSGRRVQGTPQKGVYIQGGKKKVISGH